MIDKNGQVYHDAREFAYDPNNWGLFGWIPTGKNYKFSYKEKGVLFEGMASVRIEFFNSSLVSMYDHQYTTADIVREKLKSIPVKLTREKMPIADIKIEKP